MTAQTALHLREDATAAARAAGLQYVDPDEPGFTRRRHGRGFGYYTREGEHVKDETLRRRFEDLAIPPAWTDVWICTRADGHIQATGRDEQGRKQYIYHIRWQAVRERAKFDALIPFAEGLPRLRQRVRRDLRRDTMCRKKLAATVVKLLDTTAIRIGNAHYARENDSYGLTTFLKKHVDLDGGRVVFSFVGKSGVEQEREVRNERVAEVVRYGLDAPGPSVFQYEDENGEHREIGAAEVNAYIRETLGEEFSAKDFRTWTGTVLAAEGIARLSGAEDAEEDSAKFLNAVVCEVAAQLGNTPTVCRTYYVHPLVLKTYRDGSFHALWTRNLERAGEERVRDLTLPEGATLGLLREAGS